MPFPGSRSRWRRRNSTAWRKGRSRRSAAVRTRRPATLYTQPRALAPSRPEVKYFLTTATATNFGAVQQNGSILFSPQQGGSEHNILGNKATIIGFQMKYQAYIYGTSLSTFVAPCRIVVVMDEQPSTDLIGYSSTAYWRDCLFEQDAFFGSFTHQAPRRFKVLYDKQIVLDYGIGPRSLNLDTGLIKMQKEFTVYDYGVSQAQSPFNCSIKAYFFGLEGATDNLYFNSECKVYFTDS